MNLFIQHIPSMVDIDPPTEIPFETTEELLALEIVKRFGEHPNFSHFAMSDNRLMKISDEGYHWWVVGYIKHPDQVDLPKWSGAKYRVEPKEGE